MTDQTDWRQRQLDTALELLNEGQTAFQRGDVDTADDVTEEALAILEMAEAEGMDDELRRLRVRGLNDRGLFFQHRDAPDQARPFHHRAAEVLEEVEEMGGEQFEASAVAVYLNLAQVCIFDEQYAEAREATDHGMELVADLLDRSVPGAVSLALGLYQNKTAVESYTGNFDEAIEVADKAIELAEQLMEKGEPAALGQAARVCQQLSVQLFEAERYDDALEWGRRAEEYSEEAYNHIGEQALHLYIVSQINLISYYEELEQFADAEDCLWKAIDVAGPDPEIIERGQMFYQQCQKYADKRLEKGNLPRDEVEMGAEDLEELARDAGLA